MDYRCYSIKEPWHLNCGRVDPHQLMLCERPLVLQRKAKRMFRFLTSGESHGPGLTAIIEGIPAGLKLEAEDINYHLQRRQGGYGRGGRMKIEKDQVIFRSGLRHGLTLGYTIT